MTHQLPPLQYPREALEPHMSRETLDYHHGKHHKTEKSFGSFEAFKKKFGKAAEELFGTGWAWLVKHEDGSLTVEPLEDACTPLKAGGRALLTLDVWEHAYYIDYRNRRPDFVKAFWNVAN